MKLSEVFYEAACRMSDGYVSGTSPALVRAGASEQQAREFFDLMDSDCFPLIAFDMAAQDIAWRGNDFRTFLLLMASEAVKE